ncbi:MAG: MBL fold metallo-hydrolase [Candidatus Micrarchaeota archaeon]|nr:MBL fold metallo-hydrolase [Candidatus Micrarchaeota archaeon]
MKEIAAHVFFLPGANHPLSSNAYVLESQKALALIDSGARVDVLEKASQELGKPVERVFFTHGHFDHVHAALKGKIPGQMHARDLDVLHELNAEWVNLKKPDFFTPLSDKVAWDRFSLDVMHTPGHTPGSVCFLYQDILFSGDTKFAGGGVGRTDFWGGNAMDLEKSLEKIGQLKYRLLAPGHGALQC